jgi:hypothetical protein
MFSMNSASIFWSRQPDQARDVARRRFAIRGVALRRLDPNAVCLGEIAERSVAGDKLALVRRHLGNLRADPPVELGEPAVVRLGALAIIVAVGEHEVAQDGEGGNNPRSRLGPGLDGGG